MKYAETWQSMKETKLKKHLKTDFDVNLQFIIDR